jgi:hypothetical protein
MSPLVELDGPGPDFDHYRFKMIVQMTTIDRRHGICKEIWSHLDKMSANIPAVCAVICLQRWPAVCLPNFSSNFMQLVVLFSAMNRSLNFAAYWVTLLLSSDSVSRPYKYPIAMMPPTTVPQISSPVIPIPLQNPVPILGMARLGRFECDSVMDWIIASVQQNPA